MPLRSLSLGCSLTDAKGQCSEHNLGWESRDRGSLGSTHILEQQGVQPGSVWAAPQSRIELPGKVLKGSKVGVSWKRLGFG